MSFVISITPSNPPITLAPQFIIPIRQGDLGVGNAVMMLGAQRTVLVPFRFLGIFRFS